MFMMLTLFRGVCSDKIVIAAFTPLALHLRLNDINGEINQSQARRICSELHKW